MCTVIKTPTSSAIHCNTTLYRLEILKSNSYFASLVFELLLCYILCQLSLIPSYILKIISCGTSPKIPSNAT